MMRELKRLRTEGLIQSSGRQITLLTLPDSHRA